MKSVRSGRAEGNSEARGDAEIDGQPLASGHTPPRAFSCMNNIRDFKIAQVLHLHGNHNEE